MKDFLHINQQKIENKLLADNLQSFVCKPFIYKNNGIFLDENYTVEDIEETIIEEYMFNRYASQV